jgi:hypothetical protein
MHLYRGKKLHFHTGERESGITSPDRLLVYIKTSHFASCHPTNVYSLYTTLYINYDIVSFFEDSADVCICGVLADEIEYLFFVGL